MRVGFGCIDQRPTMLPLPACCVSYTIKQEFANRRTLSIIFFQVRSLLSQVFPCFPQRETLPLCYRDPFPHVVFVPPHPNLLLICQRLQLGIQVWILLLRAHPLSLPGLQPLPWLSPHPGSHLQQNLVGSETALKEGILF